MHMSKEKKRTGIIATKAGMSSFFVGFTRVPVTLLSVSPCQVIGFKTLEKDGYNAVILGAGAVNEKKIAKPIAGIFKKNGLEPKKILKEFRVQDLSKYSIGMILNADHFSVNQYVDVQATSIGKGFAGAMKRHNFAGLEATHGVSVSHRSHGSTGQRTDPGKTFKNKKMAGHCGFETVTIQNLQIVDVDSALGLIAVKGSCPGHDGATIIVNDAVKKE